MEVGEARVSEWTGWYFHICLLLLQDDDEVDSRTMVRYSAGGGDSGTLRPANNEGTLMAPLQSGGTLVSPVDSATLSSDLGTMVINSDNEDEDEDSTMKSEWREFFLD